MEVYVTGWWSNSEPDYEKTEKVASWTGLVFTCKSVVMAARSKVCSRYTDYNFTDYTKTLVSAVSLTFQRNVFGKAFIPKSFREIRF